MAPKLVQISNFNILRKQMWASHWLHSASFVLRTYMRFVHSHQFLSLELTTKSAKSMSPNILMLHGA